jgi:hypothetical protein
MQQYGHGGWFECVTEIQKCKIWFSVAVQGGCNRENRLHANGVSCDLITSQFRRWEITLDHLLQSAPRQYQEGRRH